MVDAGQPDYEVLRIEGELEVERHNDTIERGRARLAEIERQKALNTKQARLQNLKLDAEADAIKRNSDSLNAKIAEIQKNLDLMVKEDSR